MSRDARGSSPIRKGDLLLLDVWGKLDRPGSVYYDITWVGYLGAAVPEKYAKIFAIVAAARDRAIAFVQQSLAAGRAIKGWQVDQVARERHSQSWIRQIFRASHRPQYRPGSARQRR